MDRASKEPCASDVEGGGPREYRVACPLHSHPSSPTILSLVCAVCVHPHLSTPHCLHSIARAAPNPAHTLSSRPVSLLAPGTARFRKQCRRMLSPQSGSLLPHDQEHLHVCRSCDFQNVCLMCLASADCPFSQFWPDTEALVASPTVLPAWRVVQACVPIALFTLS